eukprot:m.331085 g.331085  ORF g.331085 m.331085 type:complete len:423 (+) comp27723_c0_seq15:4717-5985(+)
MQTLVNCPQIADSCAKFEKPVRGQNPNFVRPGQLTRNSCARMLARKARVATPKRRRAGSGRTARFNPQVDVAPELRRIDRIKINLTVLQAKERTIISKMNAAREETAAKLWVAPGQALRAGKKQPPVVKPRRSTRIRREDERVGVGAIGKRASQLHQELERRLARLSADAADVAEEIDRVGEHLELAVNAPLTLGDPTLSLPDEVLLVILHCLPWEMLWKGTCATVCRRWHLLLKASPTVLRRKREGRWEAYAKEWIKPRTIGSHDAQVISLAVAPDGSLYSGSRDATVRVWGGPDLTHIRTLRGHTEGVCQLAVGPDGTVYSGSRDGTLWTWSGLDGSAIRTLQMVGIVYAIAIGAGNTVLLRQARVDVPLRVSTRVCAWSGGAAPARTLYVFTTSVDQVAISQDGRLFVRCYGDKKVYSL